MGFIPRIGDTVMDLWVHLIRNPHAAGGVGESFRAVLDGLLQLLAASSVKQKSSAHAVAVLRFLAESGNSVVSIDQVSRGLPQVNARLCTIVSDQEAELDDVDAEILTAVVNILAHTAEAPQDLGRISAVLSESAKELASMMAPLAVHNVPLGLTEALIRCIHAFDGRRPISTFLRVISKDRAAQLRQVIRNWDSMTGDYEITIVSSTTQVFTRVVPMEGGQRSCITHSQCGIPKLQ